MSSALGKVFFLIIGLIVGAASFAALESKFVGQPGWEFAGAVVGALLGALASIVVWLLTYRESISSHQRERRQLINALWADTIGLQDVLYREAEWWQEASKVDSLGTERSILGHFDTAVFNANLHRIGEIPVPAADALLALRAGVIALRQMIEIFYRSEAQMITGPPLPGEMLAVRVATAKKERG